MIAIDLRGHGETQLSSHEKNLSLDVLTRDIINVLSQLFDNRSIVLVGHSLGGSLATNVTKMIEEEVTSLKVVALMVIDIVEGSALEALTSMRSVIRSRPSSFDSISKAIEWSLKSGQVRDHESARVSIPGQLMHSVSKICASRDLELEQEQEATSSTSTTGAPPEEHVVPSVPSKRVLPPAPDVISEEEAECTAEESEGLTQEQRPVTQPNIDVETNAEDESVVKPECEAKARWTWRVDLMKTEQYWMGWFKGLSSRFLSLSCPKFLLLAGIDRLDRELTIGQMQGQFQMVVLPSVGHSVHEDAPKKVADALTTFLIRHRIVEGKAGRLPKVWPGC